MTCQGAVTLNGAVTLGNATGDDITFTGRIASDLDPKTAASSTLGDATQTWQSLFLDNTATDGGAIYFDGGSTEFIKATADGTELDISGFTYVDLNSAQIKELACYTAAKSADYTITDTDGVCNVLMTTGATDRTVTLPTPGDNTGRIITVKKVDSGAGYCKVVDEGTEKIDGLDEIYLPIQYDYVTLHCDGTTYHVIGRGSHDYKEATCSAATSTSVAGTYVNATGMSITLDPGTWLIGYGVACELTSVDTPIRGVTSIRTGSTVVSNTTGTIYSAVTGSAMGFSISRQTRISITAETTYVLSVVADRAAANAYATIQHDSLTGAITDPDNESIIWAYLLK